MIWVVQGEMALEEFLKQVREQWMMYELDLINYQNKCKLIRGWDDLFAKVKEHVNSVTAMKLSPFFKAGFYLEGIFTKRDLKVSVHIGQVSHSHEESFKKSSCNTSLERLADFLAKIQRALKGYLERERASFPRFYFVVTLSDDSNWIHGISSKEGEQINKGQWIIFDRDVDPEWVESLNSVLENNNY
uniref:Dynein heavy chain linker domain-containing protein n=1 Tax=Amphimedon queenslandica TaxID=400682 RepID=A0A1X7U7Q3_AMPQE